VFLYVQELAYLEQSIYKGNQVQSLWRILWTLPTDIPTFAVISGILIRHPLGTTLRKRSVFLMSKLAFGHSAAVTKTFVPLVNSCFLHCRLATCLLKHLMSLKEICIAKHKFYVYTMFCSRRFQLRRTSNSQEERNNWQWQQCLS
jgi:hypothetical protein